MPQRRTQPRTPKDTTRHQTGLRRARLGTTRSAGADRRGKLPGQSERARHEPRTPVDPADFKRSATCNIPISLPLQDKEVVITFDDGPIPPYSNQILDILASNA